MGPSFSKDVAGWEMPDPWELGPRQNGPRTVSEVESNEVDYAGGRLPLRVGELEGAVVCERGPAGRDCHVVAAAIDRRQDGGPDAVHAASVRHVAVFLAPVRTERRVHREEDV